MNLGTVATLGAHAMFAFLPNESFIALIAMIVMGMAYSMLACALWPLVAFIVPEYQLGTAYGMWAIFHTYLYFALCIVRARLIYGEELMEFNDK